MEALEEVLGVDFHPAEVPPIPLLAVPWEAEVVSFNVKKSGKKKFLPRLFDINR